MKTKTTNSGLIRRFIPYYKKYAGIMAIDLLCASLTTVTDLLLPLIMRQITILGMNDIVSLTIPFVLKMGSLYIVLRIIDAAAYYYMQNIGHVMGARIETDMRRDLFAHLQKLSHAYYDSHKIGQLVSRITTDLFDITEFSHHCPEEFFIAALKISVSFVILCSMNVWLTLIIFAFIPLMLICTLLFRKRMREAFRKSRFQLGEINAQVEDSLLGIRVVKSFANEDLESEKFEENNGRFLNIKKVMYHNMAQFHSTTRIFDGTMYAAVLIAGSIFVIYGQITVADLTAYMLYVSALLTSVRRIVEFTEQFQKGMSGIERFVDVMDEPLDILDSPNAVQMRDVKGDVEFSHVSFSYSDDAHRVLSDINLHVPADGRVALVGPSGGGKTTLCSLIPRFYDVSSGSLRIDGTDVRDLTLESLRANVGVVQQDVYLFSGSVLENIEYGRPGASQEEIIAAAKLAGAHEFISELEDGYNTYVGERGTRLSGGQKQRISIARVFLKNPPILILDEATSALDNESERLVQQSLDALAQGRTTFTIAHRLTTIRGAQLILVLTEDGIAEQGTHEELLKKGGLYAQLYQMYESK